MTTQTPFDKIRAAIAKLPEDQKQLIRESLESTKPVYTNDDALAEINTLTQAPYIDDFDLHKWLAAIAVADPTRIAWHVRRLRGFGGSEIGVLWGAQTGNFHPFSSDADIVAGKLLKELPMASEGNLQRGSMMEDPILRVKFREEMVKKYSAEGKTVLFRDDLFDKFMHYTDADPKLAWLVGTPDDILEVDGRLIIVDYKAPTMGTITSLQRYPQDHAPFYYEAQLMHYSTIAQKLGMDVSHTMLASLNYDKFIFDIREIQLDPQFQQELIEVGTMYWHDYVVKGLIPSNQDGKAYSRTEVDFSAPVQAAITEYAALSMLVNAAGKRRDQLQESMRNWPTPIDLSVDVVQAGPVNVEAFRTFDVEKMEKDLQSLGVDTTSAHQKTKFSLPQLLAYAKRTLGVESDSDVLLDSLRERVDGKTEIVDPASLVALARQSNSLNLGAYVTSEACEMKLSRSKTGSGPAISAAMRPLGDGLLDNAVAQLTKKFHDTKELLSASAVAQAPKAKPAI
jgi:predicted phage-related endonuclease